VQTVAQIWQFSIFKMAAVCHLGFIMCMFGPPAKSIGGIYHYAVCPVITPLTLVSKGLVVKEVNGVE